MKDSQNIMEFVESAAKKRSGIHFISLELLADFGSFPRSPDNDGLTIDLKSVDRSCALFVFVSHHWLRGDCNCEGWDGVPHPDNASGEKYQCCVEGIKRLKETYAPHLAECYVWMDYMCMNQDSKDLSEELEHYDQIVANCDCLFTPIVCGDGIEEASKTRTYYSKAWCRMEMLYAANIPVKDDESNEVRHTKFLGGLAFHLSQGRRPHFLMPSNNLKTSATPLLGPPFQHSWFEELHPFKGLLTRESDMEYIRHLMIYLQPYIDANKIDYGYKGGLNNAGQRHGHGVMTYESGDQYEGEWVCDQRHGTGEYRESNGDRYKGHWNHDQRQGQGVYTTSASEYTGEFLENQKHGQGSMVMASGDRYEGQFAFGTKTGSGVYRYASGAVYDGEWKDDKFHSQGRFLFTNGSIYEGQWEQGEHAGHGKYRYANGDVYEGDWKNDKRHGFGTLWVVAGAVYEGEWSHDKMNGKGKIRLKSGSVYEGYFKDGKYDGHGSYRDVSGEVYTGDWRDGKEHGHITVLTVDGVAHETEWNNGTLVALNYEKGQS